MTGGASMTGTVKPAPQTVQLELDNILACVDATLEVVKAIRIETIGAEPEPCPDEPPYQPSVRGKVGRIKSLSETIRVICAETLLAIKET
jgi:hypothetical protein